MPMMPCSSSKERYRLATFCPKLYSWCEKINERDDILQEPKVVSDLKQLTAAIFRTSRHFAKPHRPTIAGRLEQNAVDAWLTTRRFVLLTSAEKSGSVSLIQAALDYLDSVACLMELSLDLRLVNDGNYGELSAALISIRRQLHGLQKKYAKSAATSR